MAKWQPVNEGWRLTSLRQISEFQLTWIKKETLGSIVRSKHLWIDPLPKEEEEWASRWLHGFTKILIKQFLIVSNLVLLTFSVYQETLGQIRRFSISLSQLGSWPQCYPNIDKKELGPVDPLLSLLLSGHLHSHVVLAWEMILKINQMLKGLPWSPISTPFGGASCSSNLLQTWFYMTCCMFWVLFQWY